MHLPKRDFFTVKAAQHHSAAGEMCIRDSYARSVCREQRVAGIIGGFHLFDTDTRLARTIEYLKALSPDILYPCHCVSLKAKAEMLKYIDIEEVGVGLTIEL